MTNYPVSFFVFKRPKSTYDFLVRIHEAGIKKIYVFADGPRNTEEKILTKKVRDEINRFREDYSNLNIITKYYQKNMGLRHNIVNGLNEVFKHENASIVIEDDCLVSPDFFRFTSEMLSKYQNNSKVMSINGMTVGGDYDNYSYSFTKYPQCWGWATWKRAWDLYDSNLKTLNYSRWNKISSELSLNSFSRWYWWNILTLTKNHKISTWDYQWSYSHFLYHGLAVVPSRNLVSNIGFDNAATNTKIKSKHVSEIKIDHLTWPLNHPVNISDNYTVSKNIERRFYLSFIAVMGLLKKKYLS